MAAPEELQEHVEHAHEPFDKTVAACMAIIAALLAIVTVLGQHYNTEQLLRQQQSSDQWAFSQAKDIRRYVALVTHDTLAQLKGDPKLIGKYIQDETKYAKDHKEIQEKARDLEKERDQSAEKAHRFHFGEVFLEVAIVLSSLAILSKRRPLFLAGIASALIGVVWSGTGLLV